MRSQAFHPLQSDGTAGNPSLEQFIGSVSKIIFDQIGLDKKDLELMKIPPDYWKDMDGFIKFTGSWPTKSPSPITLPKGMLSQYKISLMHITQRV